MRPTLRIFPCILLAAALAAPLATTGCRQRGYDDASYRQWEQETRREHRDIKQRGDDEKRQYNDWRRDHEHH